MRQISDTKCGNGRFVAHMFDAQVILGHDIRGHASLTVASPIGEYSYDPYPLLFLWLVQWFRCTEKKSVVHLLTD
jgi:hypothetical protein